MSDIQDEFDEEDLSVTMPYEEIEDLFQQRYGISLEYAIEQHMMWTVRSRHEYRQWMNKLSEHNTFRKSERKE